VPRFIGGIETQLVLLARGLVQAGAVVTLITYDQGQSDQETFENIKLLKSYRPGGGLPGLRWMKRVQQLWVAMSRADSDIYLQMGAGLETGLVALGCRVIRRQNPPRFVFCLAHDNNYAEAFRAGKFGLEGRLYRYGLSRAEAIVSQTARQRNGLHLATGRDSHVITMAGAYPLTDSDRSKPPWSATLIAWVGRIVPDKRLEWLLEMARRCPDLRFEIAGTPNEPSTYAARLLEEARCLPNVEVLGRVNAKEMHHVYRRACFLCNTSVTEGFPTTFLEAWSYGVPVITTFDSDNIVRANGLGRVAKDVDGLAKAARELAGDPEAYSSCSQAARRYFYENHTTEVVTRRFLCVFEKVAGPQRERP
jgi:glycosyltransferase involved in cell wall biosynthesis